jgi:4-amino-4-deoxy-L-arabinose transferase-like glycosyltransferase
MMAGSLLLGAEARLAKTDAVLLLMSVAAFGALGRVYLAARESGQQRWWVAAIFWTALAASILIKGPVLAVFLALTIVALLIADRSAGWLIALRPLYGIPWLLLLVLPWYLAVTFRTEGAFFEESVSRDLLGKLLRGQEGHGAPPGYYFLGFFVTFWPAAPLALLAAPLAWQARTEAGVRFLLAWLVPAWIAFEVVVTKLPHYLLPAYPAAAIFIALALERAAPLNRWTRYLAWLWPLLAVGVMVLGVVLVAALGGRFGLLFWPAAIVGVMLAAAGLTRLLAGEAERALVLALLAAMATSAALYAALARTQDLFFAPRLLALARTAPCPNPALAAAGFHEPSLVFLGGTDTRLMTAPGAADFLRGGDCRVAFVDQRDVRAFDERARDIGLVYSRLGEAAGLNYSNGRRMSVLVLARKGAE